MEKLIQHLHTGLKAGASDWHWLAGTPASHRVRGTMQTVDFSVTADALAAFQKAYLPNATVDSEGYVDDAFTVESHTFRYHCYLTGGQLTAAVRHINQRAFSLEELCIPPAFKKLLSNQDGLILVTGPTGSGKSTSLTSAIDHLNATEDLHIISLEDPVEFRHTNKRSIIRQREFGRDFKSFPNAIKYAMRQDPDVIMVGEMRDYETIAAALTAAETGHLVFGTLHTGTAAGAVSRILDGAKDHDPHLISSQLASRLLGVLAQRLVPTLDGKRSGCYELLIQTPAVANQIRTGKSEGLADELARGTQHGMIAMDDALQGLFNRRQISRETALKYAVRPELLQTKLALR